MDKVGTEFAFTYGTLVANIQSSVILRLYIRLLVVEDSRLLIDIINRYYYISYYHLPANISYYNNVL